jgi:hypothetical protein
VEFTEAKRLMSQGELENGVDQFPARSVYAWGVPCMQVRFGVSATPWMLNVVQ